MRTTLRNVRYNLACILAQASAGRDRPGALVGSVPAGEAARLRDAAFAHLEEAIRCGWSNAGHLAKDADLAPLRDDPRWPGLLERVRSGGK